MTINGGVVLFNTYRNVVEEVHKFIDSNSEKVLLLKGTQQFEKHSLILEIVSGLRVFDTGLFRTDSLTNLPLQLNHAGYDINPGKKFSPIVYKTGGLTLHFDSMFSRRTWRNTPMELDFALIYPIDSFCESEEYTKKEFLRDLLNRRAIKKVFIVTGTEDEYDYSWLNKFIDRTVIYDAKALEAP